MRIAIVGAGKMGSAVGRRLSSFGHEVLFGSRNPGIACDRFPELPKAGVQSYLEATRSADAIFITVPWVAALAVVEQIRPNLQGKVVVDLTNPLAADISHLVVSGDTSAAEKIASAAPCAHVVKAFNGITAGNFANPSFSGRPAQVLYCGDDSEAKTKTRSLIHGCGYEPQDCGALSNARYLEPIAMLWLQLAFVEDRGPRFSFRVEPPFDSVSYQLPALCDVPQASR